MKKRSYIKHFKHPLAREISGGLALAIALISFSGIFRNANGPWHILDFQTFVGAFGVIGNAGRAGIVGSGGFGIKEGFFQAINMAPNMIFSVAFLAVVEYYHGLRSAEKLLTPVLKPVAGIPGNAAGILITNWQSSDASAALTISLFSDGAIDAKERDITVAYCFVAAATFGVFFSTGSMLFPYIVISTGPLLLTILVMKFVAANLMRLYLWLFDNKSATGERTQ